MKAGDGEPAHAEALWFEDSVFYSVIDAGYPQRPLSIKLNLDPPACGLAGSFTRTAGLSRDRAILRST